MVFAEEEGLILRRRRERKLGIKMLRNELACRYGLKLALDTPDKSRRSADRRGDDGSRFQVLGLDPRRTAADTRDFLKHVLEQMPFPVQRVQTDRGQKFFADEGQDDLREQPIKFRPNRPRAPHPNGPRPAPAGRASRRIGRLLRPMVERVQRTALEELWPTVDPPDPNLLAQLEAWRTFDNHDRPHRALGGSTPAERIKELATKIPALKAIQAAYDPSREFIRSQNTRYRRLPTNTRLT